MTKHARSVFSVDVTGLETGQDQPAYMRICDRLRAAITSGALAPNARLPSSRTLAKDLGVARNTVDWALGQLVADGYIVRRRGAGTFVVPQLPERDAPPLVPRARESRNRAARRYGCRSVQRRCAAIPATTSPKRRLRSNPRCLPLISSRARCGIAC